MASSDRFCFSGMLLSVFKRILEYIQMFNSEHWYSYSIHGNFKSQILFKYYVLCLKIFKNWSLKITGNAGIKEVLFSFLT